MAKARAKEDPPTPYPRMRAYPCHHFGWHEVACKCGECSGFPDRPVLECDSFRFFCTVMDSIRGNLGKPVIVNSWYRCPDHPIEAKKRIPGVHTHAIAADLRIRGWDVVEAIQASIHAVRYHHTHKWHYPGNVLGFGFQQYGATRYLHVDVGGLLEEFEKFRGNVWTY